MLDSPVQAAPSQLASGAQLTPCTACRQGAVVQAVQIPKQAPEGSCWGLLDSLEHTNFSPLASQKLLKPLAGPGDVLPPPRLIWIRKRRELILGLPPEVLPQIVSVDQMEPVCTPREHRAGAHKVSRAAQALSPGKSLGGQGLSQVPLEL